MKTIFAATALALSAFASAPSFAADFLLAVGPGTSSANFGNTVAAQGPLADTYTFSVPAGMANGFVGSIALNDSLDVDITSVLLDGTAFAQTSSGATDLYILDTTSLSAGAHTIFVNGTWGATGGSYGGTLNYVVTAVPEPATWALMIGGFGMVGGAMRTRKSALRRTHA